MNNKYPLISAVNRDFSSLQTFNIEQCQALCTELREFIKEHVAQTGGHLASNLGVIELTVALLRVFDFTHDRLVWDVGHQSYAWKILTGRAWDFKKLRMKDGISGFPKPEESPFDHFGTGHATTSISAALGMAAANKTLGSAAKAIAVIGDGALTGGMAWEALNNISQIDPNLLIILNDNEMSIERNVGAVANQLAHLRISKRYLDFKRDVKNKLAASGSIGRLSLRLGRSLKAKLRAGLGKERAFFCEEYGCRYYGPFDGHDYEVLEAGLKAIKELRQPILLHLLTEKGRGYAPAAQDPVAYHGVKPFVLEEDEVKTSEEIAELAQANIDSEATYTEVFGQVLCDEADTSTYVAITAAMSSGTGLSAFAEKYPQRFYDVGIAEQHAVCFAAGLAKNNVKAVCAIYATFLQRALDALIHDVCLQNLPIILAVDRSGLVGEDGATHQGIYDLNFAVNLPNLEIFVPSDTGLLAAKLRKALRAKLTTPLMLRYPKGVSALPRALQSLNCENTFDAERDMARILTLRQLETDAYSQGAACYAEESVSAVLKKVKSVQTFGTLQNLLLQAGFSLDNYNLGIDGHSSATLAGADTAWTHCSQYIISSGRLTGYVWQALFGILQRQAEQLKSVEPQAGGSSCKIASSDAGLQVFRNVQTANTLQAADALQLPNREQAELRYQERRSVLKDSCVIDCINYSAICRYFNVDAGAEELLNSPLWQAFKQADKIVILEECAGVSPLWAKLAANLRKIGSGAEIIVKTLPADTVIEQGKINELLADWHMDVGGIADFIS